MRRTIDDVLSFDSPTSALASSKPTIQSVVLLDQRPHSINLQREREREKREREENIFADNYNLFPGI